MSLAQCADDDLLTLMNSFGRDQTCALLLGLASGNTFLDGTEGSSPTAIRTVSPEIAAVAKQAFYDFGERPIWAERAMYGTTGMNPYLQRLWSLTCDAPCFTHSREQRHRNVQWSSRRIGTVLLPPRSPHLESQNYEGWGFREA